MIFKQLYSALIELAAIGSRVEIKQDAMLCYIVLKCV